MPWIGAQCLIRIHAFLKYIYISNIFSSFPKLLWSFTYAWTQLGFTPISLRGLALLKSDRCWADIGGLDCVKEVWVFHYDRVIIPWGGRGREGIDILEVHARNNNLLWYLSGYMNRCLWRPSYGPTNTVKYLPPVLFVFVAVFFFMGLQGEIRTSFYQTKKIHIYINGMSSYVSDR